MPIVGGGGRLLTPRTEGWPNVVVVLDESGAVGRLVPPPKLEDFAPNADGVLLVPKVEGVALVPNADVVAGAPKTDVVCPKAEVDGGWPNADVVVVFPNAEGFEVPNAVSVVVAVFVDV